MNEPRTYWTICHLCGRESGDTNGKYDGTRWCGCSGNEDDDDEG
jgi:ssDNA-binding Zn-finger/Zn-ribbon topoisomerase 1